jgi:uncharacterized protein with PQ loop repeat
MISAAILGWVATGLFTLMLFPQIVKTLKIKKAEQVSGSQYVMCLIANIIALAYSIMIAQPPLMVKYVLGIIISTAYLVIYLKYRG